MEFKHHLKVSHNEMWLLSVPDCLQVEAAVAAAKEAFPDWSARSPKQRAEVLNKLADLVEAHLEEFAQAESRDQGVSYCFNMLYQLKTHSHDQSDSQIACYQSY